MSNEELIEGAQMTLSMAEIVLSNTKKIQNKHLTIEAQSKINTRIACLETCVMSIKEEIRLLENSDYAGASEMAAMADFYSQLAVEYGT